MDKEETIKIEKIAAIKKNLPAKNSKAPQESEINNSKNNPDPRLEALKGVMHQIERSYGKGAIQQLGKEVFMDITTTASGSLTLDIALGTNLRTLTYPFLITFEHCIRRRLSTW